MQNYGIIQLGRLIITNQAYPGAKPVVYEDVPLFDQEAQYVKQQAPVDAGNHIFVGCEVCEVENADVEEPDLN